MSKPAHHSAMELIQINMDNFYTECKSLFKKMDDATSARVYANSRTQIKKNLTAMITIFAAYSRYLHSKFTVLGKQIPFQLQEFHGKMSIRVNEVRKKLEEMPRTI